MEPVKAFNAAGRDRLTADLMACCAVPAWAEAVAAGRPYPDRAAVLAAADAAARALSWDDVLRGLAAHPRIGERPTGAGREAAWSRAEQAGAAHADAATRAALVEANRAYEQRFGHVYLVFASGRSDTQLLDAARRRLGNDDDTERAIVADELRKIALLRLERLIDGAG